MKTLISLPTIHTSELAERGSVFTTLTGGTEALAGMALFEDFEIRFNFPSQTISIIK